jgi:type VI secretion system VasD/TssJ family lipoprotein
VVPEARFVGAVAAFRDIRNSKWKTLTAAPEKGLMDMLRKDKLTVKVAKSEVAIVVAD